MIFLNSNFLIFMIIPLIILTLLIITNKKTIHRIFDKKILQKIIIKRNYLGIFGKNILLFGSLFLIIFSLSRPVIPKKEIQLKTKKNHIAILLDASASMLAKDIYPNRFEFAKEKIKDFIKQSNAKISIYAFNRHIYQIAPKSEDKENLIFLIDHLKPSENFFGSTNLEFALKNIKEKNILIFSDGDLDLKDISFFKNLDKNIIFYITSTKSGAPIYKNGFLIKDKNQNIVISKPNQKIQEFAKIINFSYTNKDLKDFLFKEDKEMTFKIKQYKEFFYYPLVFAFILVLFSFFSLKKLKNIKFFLLFLSFYPTYSKALVLDFYYIYKANKAYQQKNYQQSSIYFKKVADSKKDAKSYYDLANSLYKQKKYKKAIYFYQKVVTDSKDLQYKTFFNIGNCYFKLKDYKRAYSFYKIAKKIKNTKKVKTNLQILSKFYKKAKEEGFTITPSKKKKTLDTKIKTILIPIYKSPKENDEKPW